MTREQRLEFCNKCTNRAFNPKSGVTCKLTGALADFENSCESFQLDNQREKEIELKKHAAAYDNSQGSGINARSIANGGMGGGIAFIAIGVAWLIGGLFINRIFFYPIIMIVAGIIALVRGISKAREDARKKALGKDLIDSDL